jgi:hypothetical protein
MFVLFIRSRLLVQSAIGRAPSARCLFSRAAFLTLLLLIFAKAGPAQAARVVGTVVATRASCDYFLVKTSGGYDLLEWESGYEPDRGDVIIGPFEGYGFIGVFDKTAASSVRVYVEDYWLNQDDAYSQLDDKCA